MPQSSSGVPSASATDGSIDTASIASAAIICVEPADGKSARYAPYAHAPNAAAPKAITTADTPFCAAPATPGSHSSGGGVLVVHLPQRARLRRAAGGDAGWFCRGARLYRPRRLLRRAERVPRRRAPSGEEAAICTSIESTLPGKSRRSEGHAQRASSAMYWRRRAAPRGDRALAEEVIDARASACERGGVVVGRAVGERGEVAVQPRVLVKVPLEEPRLPDGEAVVDEVDLELAGERHRAHFSEVPSRRQPESCCSAAPPPRRRRATRRAGAASAEAAPPPAAKYASEAAMVRRQHGAAEHADRHVRQIAAARRALNWRGCSTASGCRRSSARRRGSTSSANCARGGRRRILRRRPLMQANGQAGRWAEVALKYRTASTSRLDADVAWIRAVAVLRRRAPRPPGRRPVL